MKTIDEKTLPREGSAIRKIYDVLLTHEYMTLAAIAEATGIEPDKLWPSDFTALERRGLATWKQGKRSGMQVKAPRMWRATTAAEYNVVAKNLERVAPKAKKASPPGQAKQRTGTAVRQEIAACFAQLQKLTDELEARLKDELLAKMRDL